MTVKPGWARKHPTPKEPPPALQEPPPAPQEPPPSAAAERPLWRFTHEEQRLLWITVVATFAGGLGSIILSAIILGGAFALARVSEPGAWFGLGLGAFLATLIAIGSINRLRERKSRMRQLGNLVLLAWFGGIAVICILALIGLAARITGSGAG